MQFQYFLSNSRIVNLEVIHLAMFPEHSWALCRIFPRWRWRLRKIL